MSYTLERGPNSQESSAVKWIPYNPAPFEMDEMPFRHEQLQIRTRECTRTLELLSKLNQGTEMEHFLQPTMDLAKFKVFQRPIITRAIILKLIQLIKIAGPDGSELASDCGPFVRIDNRFTDTKR